MAGIHSSGLPIAALSSWATLNGVTLNDVEISTIPGRGNGLLAKGELTAAEDAINGPNLLIVPRGLVLSTETVGQYAREDADFKKLLDAVGGYSARGDIMLFLLVQVAILHRGETKPSGLSTPWTSYLKFLPPDMSLPTLWTEKERSLLKGTSLETAASGKMLALEHEFDRIRELSSDIPCWQAMFWDNMTVNLKTWLLLDAWYRSRSLELPRSGVALVPCLDMVNHSTEPNAHYEETAQDEVVLRLKAGCRVSEGDEVTISYGSDKPMAEMLYSYGFIPDDAPEDSVRLDYGPFPDDPLGKAKLVVFGSRPVLLLKEGRQSTTWDCPFSYLKCVNMEDGVAFKVALETDGGHHLRMFWHDEDVTESASDLASLISGDERWPLFLLRAVTDIQDRVSEQLERIKSGIKLADVDGDVVRDRLVDSATKLRQSETRVLESAVHQLDIERGIQLSAVREDETLMASFGKMETTQNDLGGEPFADEDDDFS